MSNHRPPTDPGPSLVSIWAMAASSLAIIFYSVWIAWGATDDRHWTGAALGFVLALLMTGQTLARAVDRGTARERQERHRARRREERDPGEAIARRWPEPIPQANPAPEYPEPRCQEAPGMEIESGPSPAALTQVPMPIDLGRWSSEAERQAWLDDQDTQIFTRPPEWRS